MALNNDLVKPDIRLGMAVGDIVESLEVRLGSTLDNKNLKKDGTWYRAKIVKIHKPGSEVRIHYLGWKTKWDKNVKLTSPSVRYEKKRLSSNASISVYKVGQKVMATFTDGNKVRQFCKADFKSTSLVPSRNFVRELKWHISSQVL